MKRSSFQTSCPNPACLLKKVKRDREKREDKERAKKAADVRAAKDKAMTTSARLKRAREDAFQVYIKLRDLKWFADRGKPPACIMCGRRDAKVWDAAHFISVGSRSELQFHPDNCHLSCDSCNRFRAQSDTDYRKNLILKVGAETVKYLEEYHTVIKWNDEEIEEIRDYFKSLCQSLKK